VKDERKATTEAVKRAESQEIEPWGSKTPRADQKADQKKKEKLCSIMRISSDMAVIITVGSGTEVIPI